jgi:hypothetical protein
VRLWPEADDEHCGFGVARDGEDNEEGAVGCCKGEQLRRYAESALLELFVFCSKYGQ